MVFFIFTLVLMFSLSGVLYLMVRALPRMAEADDAMGADGAAAPRGLLDRWAHSDIPEKIDGAFNGWLLKFLRKFKVFVLKLDNAVSSHLHKIHREKIEIEKKGVIDFKEISGKGEAETKED